jgi:hypothetical protein
MLCNLRQNELMKISPYTIYLEMQPNALLVRQNFIICKKWVLHGLSPRDGAPSNASVDGGPVDRA